MTGQRDALLRSAIDYHQQGDLDTAQPLYEQLLAKTPDNAQLLELSGVLAAQLQEPALAEERLRRAVELEPDRASAHGNLGNLHLSQERLEEALESFERAASLDPANTSISYNLGVAQSLAGKHEDAALSFQKTLSLDPGIQGVRLPLVAELELIGRLEEAQNLLEEAIADEPANVATHRRLASVLERQEQYPAAAASYERVIELDPSQAWLGHLVSAYRGESPRHPPHEYVTRIFDGRAEDYDFVESLRSYQAAEVLSQMLEPQLGKGRVAVRALDLGCGTGIMGLELAGHAESITGVDLSAGMVDQAKATQAYSELHVEEIETFLASSSESFDLVTATDVLPYIGDLEDLFALVRARIGEQSLFAITTEVGDGESFRLQTSGRYTHGAEYLGALATASSFEVVRREEQPLRNGHEGPVLGNYFLLTPV